MVLGAAEDAKYVTEVTVCFCAWPPHSTQPNRRGGRWHEAQKPNQRDRPLQWSTFVLV